MTATAQQPGQVATLATLRNPAANVPDVSAGFGSLKSFELMQRMATLLCASTLVPTQYQAMIVKRDKYGNIKEQKENPNALANAVVALNMSQRMGADPLMIMQNLFVIEGRPSWSSQYIIAGINGCGKFSPLRFKLQDLGEKSVEYTETFWEGGQRQSRAVVVDIADVECTAWAVEKETGERIEGPPVTMEMAVKEGWYTKAGSKWQTMPAVMLRYRAASFFGKLYSPELLMGLKTAEEELDIIEVAPETGEILSVTTESLRTDMKRAEVAPEQAQPVTNQEPSNHVAKPEATPPTTQKRTTTPAAHKQEQPPQAPPPEDPGPQEEPQAQAASALEKQPESIEIPPKVKAFMREINAATEGGSLAVDTWRMKHHNRVANALGGAESPLYKQVMEYADQTYKGMLEAEADQKNQGGKSNGNFF